MAKFSFVVDREYQVVNPLQFYGNWDLKGETFGVQPGDKVVYKGVVELAGSVRYHFLVEGKKAYAQDRALLEDALSENYDALIQVG